MACTSLKDAVVGGVALAWDDTGTTDQTSGQIVNDITVQVWHNLYFVRFLTLQESAYHNVELVGVGDHLHTGIVNNQIVSLDHWVILGNFTESAQEHTVSLFHNVGLVNAGNLLASLTESKVKSELDKM